MATQGASKNAAIDITELLTMLSYVVTLEVFEALSHGDNMFQNQMFSNLTLVAWDSNFVTCVVATDLAHRDATREAASNRLNETVHVVT
jgi:hypothetical protein